MNLSSALREAIAGLTRRLPIFRGLGRSVLLIDRVLTDPSRTESYMVTARVNGRCRLWLDLRCREQKFAYYYGRWETELITAVKRNYTQGVFYDIGASIGLYAMLFGRVCQERGTYVRAFEPVPANLHRLRSQFSLNQLGEDDVHIEPVALADAPGTTQLTLVDGGRPGNAKISTSGDISAIVTMVDTVWEQNGRENVGFIKIDTEGWDVRILQGARQLISTCRPNLLVEFNRERMHNLGIPLDETWRYLVDDLQYRCFRVDDAGREHRLHSPGAWENLMFVASERPASTALIAGLMPANNPVESVQPVETNGN